LHPADTLDTSDRTATHRAQWRDRGPVHRGVGSAFLPGGRNGSAIDRHERTLTAARTGRAEWPSQTLISCSPWGGLTLKSMSSTVPRVDLGQTGLPTILATACVGQNITRHLGQTEHVVEFAISQQPSIGGHQGSRETGASSGGRNPAEPHPIPIHPLGAPWPPRSIQGKILIAISESRRPRRNSVRYLNIANWVDSLCRRWT